MEEREKEIASGISRWWVDQGRYAHYSICDRLQILKWMCLGIFLMQVFILILILFRL